MPKCRANRKARRKRNARHLQQVFDKRVRSLAELLVRRARGGLSAAYYAVDFGPVKTRLRDGRRTIDAPGMGVRVRALPQLAALYRELIQRCGDVTVKLPAELFSDRTPGQ